MIKSATSDEFGAPCINAENVILFLTDGSPTVGTMTAQDTINSINEQRGNLPLKIFTYGLGSNLETNYTFLR